MLKLNSNLYNVELVKYLSENIIMQQRYSLTVELLSFDTFLVLDKGK